MKNFTERQHAFISATFYKRMKEQNFAKYTDVFRMATQIYAQQRGSRMAQRALRDGKELDFATYRAYGEWKLTEETLNELNTKVNIENESNDACIKIWGCPWSTQFKNMGLEDGGIAYCDDLDISIARGFNPYITFEVNQTQYGDKEFCLQYQRDAKFKNKIESPKDLPLSFEYHCAHIYYTFSRLVISIYKTAGVKLSAEVMSDFANEYGKESADLIINYKDVDFNYI